MRTIVFIGAFLLVACIKQQKDKEPDPLGNPDYHPFCPPIDPVPQPNTSEWKKYQQLYDFFEPEGTDEDSCLLEEDTER